MSVKIVKFFKLLYIYIYINPIVLIFDYANNINIFRINSLSTSFMRTNCSMQDYTL